MNKVVTIHLDSIAYQLEEGAYDMLQAYLESAKQKLAQNPDKDEILKDLEQAIGAKLSGYLSAHKNVLTLPDVEAVLKEMGPVAAEGDAADTSGTGTGGASGGNSDSFAPHKKLYRISEGRWIAGVCNGLAAYFNVDVTLIRILFVLLTIFSHGLGGLIYIVMMLIVPVARTPKEYEQAAGVPPVTAQELVDRARKSVEDFANSGEWKYWRDNWKQHYGAWESQHKTFKHARRQQRKAWKHQGKAWQDSQYYGQYNGHYNGRHSAVSELFGIACATLAITFALWFLYGHVTLFHNFFDALHNAYESFIYSLAQVAK